MPEGSENVGLMAAIAPMAQRRPVHIIVSAGPDGKLNVVVAPKHLDAKEDPAIARGFAVTESPDVLDRDLGREMASLFVPAHLSLQSVLDQAARATEDARQATLRKSTGTKAGGAKKDAAGTPQITFDASPAAAEPASPAAAPPPAAAPTPDAPDAPDPADESGTSDAAEAAGDVAHAPAAAGDPVAAAAPTGDAVSNLFD